MAKYRVYWDTDGVPLADCGLQKIVEVPDDINEEDVADWLSDKYGWCVREYYKED